MDHFDDEIQQQYIGGKLCWYWRPCLSHSRHTLRTRATTLVVAGGQGAHTDSPPHRLWAWMGNGEGVDSTATLYIQQQ